MILDILFPSICFGCSGRLRGGESSPICDTCIGSLSKVDALICPKCRGRVPFRAKGRPIQAAPCHPRADYLLLALSGYENPVARSLVRCLKFERRAAIGRALAVPVVRLLRQVAFVPDLIIPIPLSSARLCRRGFNQAGQITAQLATEFKVEHAVDILRRVRDTRPQTLLRGSRARTKNLENCFVVTNAAAVNGKIILLVDDVWTSGATMNAAARELKVAGAQRILAVVIARAR